MSQSGGSLDDFGLPFTLSEAEEKAVRQLHSTAVEKGLKVHSVFELAELGEEKMNGCLMMSC